MLENSVCGFFDVQQARPYYFSSFHENTTKYNHHLQTCLFLLSYFKTLGSSESGVRTLVLQLACALAVGTLDIKKAGIGGQDRGVDKHETHKTP